MFDHRYAHPLDDTYDTYPAQEYYAENSYWNFYGHDQVVEVQIVHQETMASENTSEFYSPPPLYQSSPSPLTSPSPSHPLLREPNYWSIPTNPRAEAILRAQRELMEMVKHMPESSYELTLKDMVEEHRKIESQTDYGPQVAQRSTSDHDKEVSSNETSGAVNVIKREESKKKDKKHVRSESFGTKKHVRSESFETKRVVLNMLFPIPSKSKKTKKHVKGKVCPKPAEGVVKSERDWWKRKFGAASNDTSDQSSGTSDTTSGSSWSTGSSGRSSAGAEISYTTTTRTRKKKGFLKRCYKCSNPEKQTIE